MGSGELHQLPAHSPLRRAVLPEHWRAKFSPDEVCPVLELPRRVEGLSRCVPSRQLETLQYYRRRLARRGSAQIELAGRKNLEELFAALLRLHRARWSAKKRPGMLSNEAVQRFHREAAWALLARGALRLHTLRLDGATIAVLYGFVRGRRAWGYLGGFDPAFKTLSLGMLMVGHALEEAIRDGVSEFDFLRGQEAYKYAWGAKDRPTYRCDFSSP